MHRLENIERQEEKENDSVEINLKSHLVIEFGQKETIGDNFRTMRSLCYCINKFKDYHNDHIQRNQRWPRPAASTVSAEGCCMQLARKCVVLPYHPFGCNQE